MSRNITIDEFYQRYDICMGIDLLGHMFIHDPLWRICSPGFDKIQDLDDYIKTKMNEYTDRLDY